MRQMSPEQREKKNKYQREYFKEYWIRMSPEQRKKYRERGYKYQRKDVQKNIGNFGLPNNVKDIIR